MTQALDPVKGRLTIINGASGPAGRSYRDFALNPTEMKESHGFKYPSFDIPGNSHPMIQAGQGTNRVISFVLRLDAMVGSIYQRALRDRQEEGDTDFAGRPQGILSIADDLRWYESLTLTNGNARLGLLDTQPPVVLFSYGRMYRAVPCVVEKRDTTITQMSESLEPIRADVSLQLILKIENSVARSDVYDDSTSRGRFD